jgi:FtsP/CotA-like multicopper oxidase with cupredoxin domain
MLEFAVGGVDMEEYLQLFREELAVGGEDLRAPRWDKNTLAPDREFVVFFESQLNFQTINGRGFVGNTPVFRSRVGEVVQFDVLALGDEHHTFHIHGHRWRQPDGTPIDTRTIGPAESFAVRFREDVPGTWLYHCHVEEHMRQGMIGLYRVRR